jgi:hypothetical protein
MGALHAFKKLIKREERRQYPRKLPSGLISFGIDECIFSGLVKNISMGGLFIQTDTKRIMRDVFAKRAGRNDQPIIKFMQLSPGVLQVKATGNIVRMNRHGVGVEFVSIKDGLGYLSDPYLHTPTGTVNNDCEKRFVSSTLCKEGHGLPEGNVSVFFPDNNNNMVETEDTLSVATNRPEGNDEALRAAIIGTWVARYHQLGGGETSYFVDGYATASVYADSPELVPPNAHIRGTWNVSRGRLITRVLVTNPPGILPVGHTTTCWVESVNAEELVLITNDKTRLVETRRAANR